MFTYSPKLHHAIITALIGIGFMLLSAKAQGRTLAAMNTAAFGFALLTVLVMWMLIVQSFNDQTREQTDWMIAYGKLDEEGRAVIGLVFPTMRYRARGSVVRPYFEDTFVTITTFQTFLKNSDKHHIMPERNTGSATISRDDWTEIKEWLEDHGKVEPDSAAGSHSWEWIGDWYARYCGAYLMAGRELRYKDAGASAVYASETEGQELA